MNKALIGLIPFIITTIIVIYGHKKQIKKINRNEPNSTLRDEPITLYWAFGLLWMPALYFILLMTTITIIDYFD